MVLLVAALASASAQPPMTGGQFTITRATIDVGGGEATGGRFAVQGTIGQSDAGELGWEGFELRGGFWVSTGEHDGLFRDGFEETGSRGAEPIEPR